MEYTSIQRVFHVTSIARNEYSMPAIKSLEDDEGLRCVDIIEREDGTYAFKEFRKDREDMGRWLLARDFSSATYSSPDEAISAAASRIPWLSDVIRTEKS
jgi:hypothetical protein